MPEAHEAVSQRPWIRDSRGEERRDHREGLRVPDDQLAYLLAHLAEIGVAGRAGQPEQDVPGIAELIGRSIDGQPTLLMDDVGVGKTCQVLGLIATYAQYYDYHKKHGRFPGKFGKHVCLFTFAGIKTLTTR